MDYIVQEFEPRPTKIFALRFDGTFACYNAIAKWIAPSNVLCTFEKADVSSLCYLKLSNFGKNLYCDIGDYVIQDCVNNVNVLSESDFLVLFRSIENKNE